MTALQVHAATAGAASMPLSARAGEPDNLRFWVPEALAGGGELSTPRTWIPDRVHGRGATLGRPRLWLSPQREGPPPPQPNAPVQSPADLASLMQYLLAPAPQITRARAPNSRGLAITLVTNLVF